MVLIPGGPGLPPDYLNVFRRRLDKNENIQFASYPVFSTDIELTPNNLVQSLEQMLNLKEADIILGHSFGALIAIEFSLQYPEKVRGLICTNLSPSYKKYNRNLEQRLRALPDAAQQKIETLRKNKNFGADYWSLVFEYWFPVYGCRTHPLPEDLQASIANFDQTLYERLMGPDMFHINGVISDWTCVDKLAQLTVPTLFICGEYDTVLPEDLELMASITPNSSTYVCPDTAHYSFLENESAYSNQINQFLDGLSD